MKKLDLMLRGHTCQRSNQLRTPLTLPAPVPAGLASILILDHRIMFNVSWVLIIFVIYAETQDFGIRHSLTAYGSKCHVWDLPQKSDT